MIVTIPQSLERFCERIGSGLTAGQRRALPMLLAGLLLAKGRRSQAALGRTVVTEPRHRASVSKLLRRGRFRTRELVDEAVQAEIDRQPGPRDGSRRTWFVVIDGTSTKRGGFTKIANARQYKVSRRKKKGGTPSTKSHTFVMGLVLTERGVRIPLTRRTWRTKKYCRTSGKKYLKQTELAELMLRSLRLPADVDVVVLVDEYFEGQWLHEVCGELGYTYIVPVKSDRCFIDEDGNRSHLHARGRSLPESEGWRKLTLLRGSEETARYRRYSVRRTRAKRHYRFFHEVSHVAKLGPVGVVYSWKKPSCRPRRNDSAESFKVLVTNSLELSGARIVEYYELRWQIELWFRELKSHLGLADYSGTDFEAFERHVDLVMLSFLFLERRRCELRAAARSRRRCGELAAMRTTGLQSELAIEAMRDDLSYLRRLLLAPGGHHRILHLYSQMRKAG